MSEKLTIAYVGLGVMGGAGARHLIEAGHEVRIWARRPEQTTALAEKGATVCASAAEAAQGADFAFTNVANTQDVEEVALGENGYADTLAKGSVVIDNSTIDPIGARKIGEQLDAKGIEFLDAPVSGGQAGAEAGTLTIMCGGKPEVFEKSKVVLNIVGKTLTLIGDWGAGSVAKACNQLIIGGTVNAIAEGFKLARKQDVDPAKVREALLGGMAQSKALDMHGQRMLDDNFAPGFRAVLHLKDIDIAINTGKACGVDLPSAEEFRDRLIKVIDAGMADLDSSVASKAIDL